MDESFDAYAGRSSVIDLTLDETLDFRSISNDLGVDAPKTFEVEYEADKIVFLLHDNCDDYGVESDGYEYVNFDVNSYPPTASSSMFSNPYFDGYQSTTDSNSSVECLDKIVSPLFTCENKSLIPPSNLKPSFLEEKNRSTSFDAHQLSTYPTFPIEELPRRPSDSHITYESYEIPETDGYIDQPYFRNPFDNFANNCAPEIEDEGNNNDPTKYDYPSLAIDVNESLFDKDSSIASSQILPLPSYQELIGQTRKFKPPRLVIQKKSTLHRFKPPKVPSVDNDRVDTPPIIPNYDELKSSIDNSLVNTKESIEPQNSVVTDEVLPTDKKSTNKFRQIDYREKLSSHGYTKEIVSEHKLQNADKTCLNCNKKFRNYWDFAGHFTNSNCWKNTSGREHFCVVKTCPFSILGFSRKLCLRHHCHDSHFTGQRVSKDCKEWEPILQGISFYCDQCGKSFYRRDSLVRHVNAVHKMIKPKRKRKAPVPTKKVSKRKKKV